MKKAWGLVLAGLIMLLAASALAAESGSEVTIGNVPAKRIDWFFPNGLEFDEETDIKDGLVTIVIDAEKTDWNKVLEDQGTMEPYLRFYIQKPDDRKGGFAVSGADGLKTDEERIVYLKDVAFWETGDVSTQMSFASIADNGNGTITVTPREIKTEDQMMEMCCVVAWNKTPLERETYLYERLQVQITYKDNKPFTVSGPAQASAEMLEPTKNVENNSNEKIDVTISRGKIEFKLLSADVNAYPESLINPYNRIDLNIPVSFKAPEGAKSCVVVHNGRKYQVSINDAGIATMQQFAFNLIEGKTLNCFVLWYDQEDYREEEAKLLDSGAFSVTTVTALTPAAAYMEDWQAVAFKRIRIVSPDEQYGISPLYYEGIGMVNINMARFKPGSEYGGWYAVTIIPPAGATYYRIAKIPMKPDEFLGNNEAGLKKLNELNQTVAQQKLNLAGDGFSINFDLEDFANVKRVELERVTVFKPTGSDVGFTNLIYWYASEKDAMEKPNAPMRKEFMCIIQDGMQVDEKLEPTVRDENEIEGSVKEITAVDTKGQGRKLHITRLPQSGDRAEHWQIELVDEQGREVNFEGDMEFYVPYPEGMSYDTVTSGENRHRFTLRHYDDDQHSRYEDIEITPTEKGLLFRVGSLSPFVMMWDPEDNGTAGFPTDSDGVAGVPEEFLAAPASEIPQTGDERPVALYAVFLLAALGAGMLLLRRRRA